MRYQKPGEKLQDIRVRAGFTQKQVADALKIDRSTYASYEIGRSQPSPATLLQLSKIFNTAMENLLDDELIRVYVQDAVKFSPSHGAYGGGNAYDPGAGEQVFDLSKDEHALLALYRAADPELRKRMLTQLKEMFQEGSGEA